MFKAFLLSIAILFTPSLIFAQFDTSKLLNQIADQMDSKNLVNGSAERACKCASKIKTKKKTQEEILELISECIDKEVTAFQMSNQLFDMLKTISKDSTKKDHTITVSDSKNSESYKSSYFEIETALMSSCDKARKLSANRDEVQSENSISDNKKARKLYDEGTTLMNNEKYEKAIEKFLKSIEIDNKFAYAWDHLGLSYRRLNNLDKAIESYERSLVLDPFGQMPLQNLGVAYEKKGESDKAIDIYKRLINLQPKNPEGFFGAARNIGIINKKYAEALPYALSSYKLYVAEKSPYRADAETLIATFYGEMKKAGNEAEFLKICKENDVNFNIKN